MHLKRLTLSNFRSYQNLDLELEPGTTTLIGDNGSGKTNIAEAIIYLSQLSSHRVSTNQPLIHLGAEQAIIKTIIKKENRILEIDLEINAKKSNRAQINGNPVRNQKEILGACQSVYFSPEDLDLVRGDPSQRRTFMDQLLITRAPRLAGVISDYDRVVKQRNVLLKTRAPQSALNPWNEQLISIGANLTAQRINLCEVLNPFVYENYKALNEVKPAEISYKSSINNLTSDIENNANIYKESVQELQYQEIERGTTLIGPHRDDLNLQIGQFPAKGYASHGESWSMAISLKLGAFSLLRKEGSEPILILDDVFAELDSTRRAHLMEATQVAEQTIITAAVEEDLPEGLNTVRRYIEPGRVTERKTQ